ncbi:hypothetical protein L6164_008388 [Bauhinia variegata]|uniref:Uncharacterized protein n=1 Tax=Bauhinia variegata TaxID=167791 RepID=A0ACB9PGG4_BAUVA|nr:hypothetical protein L6164_008388 [Bauhinia variegata]
MASYRSKTSSYITVPVFLAAFLGIGVIGLLAVSSSKRPNLKYGVSCEMVNVVNEFPHDPEAFTQGLLYVENDTLFESTGIYGRSSVRKVALQTGKVEHLHKMDNSFFGEGLTLLGERLFQVTWLQDTGFIYDRNNLSQLGKFTNPMEDGWGLATDGKDLFGSDGSSTLYQIDPQTFEVISKQVVTYNGQEVQFLNELEFVNGEVWANVYGVDCIARISPKDGKVLGWILLQNLRAELLTAGNQGIDVLNGIAWDGKQDRIFVTGKLWPKLFEIKPYPIEKTEGIIEKLCLPETLQFGSS